MRHDMGCGFVSWHKHVEGLHVYLTLTIHLSLTRVSRGWSNSVPSMTSTARKCWSTSDHLFVQCSGPQARPWSSGPLCVGWWDVLHVQCWVLCTQAYRHSAAWSVWQGDTGAAGQEDLLGLSAWTVPLGLCLNTSLTAPVKVACHCSASMQLSHAN